jgi:hypothetical protein
MFFKGYQSKKKGKTSQPVNIESLVCKFVFDGLGHPIGESISVEDDLIIVKSDESYLGIPLKHVESDGKKIIVKGLVDQQNAKRLGERWRKAEMKREGVFYHK